MPTYDWKKTSNYTFEEMIYWNGQFKRDARQGGITDDEFERYEELKDRIYQAATRIQSARNGEAIRHNLALEQEIEDRRAAIQTYCAGTLSELEMFHDHFPGVYCIRHMRTGREYVGQSNDILGRLRGHRSALLKGYGSGRREFWQDFENDGPDAFEWRVLERALSKERNELISLENKWIHELEPFYNAGLGYDDPATDQTVA